MTVLRCWHCNGKLSAMNPPKGQEYWFSLAEIEPGRFVKVHKRCLKNVLEDRKKITAAPREQP